MRRTFARSSRSSSRVWVFPRQSDGADTIAAFVRGAISRMRDGSRASETALKQDEPPSGAVTRRLLLASRRLGQMAGDLPEHIS
jgi:hypothetical protein